MRLRQKKWIWVVLALFVVTAGAVAVRYLVLSPPAHHVEPELAAKPSAPADLAKLRDAYAAGVAALERKDGPDAVKHFSAFDFGSRAVEEYRLFQLAAGHTLAGNETAARATLARLWNRNPRLVHAPSAGSALGSGYATIGDWRNAARVYEAVAARTDDPAAAASARWSAVECRFFAGDVAGASRTARDLIIKSPRSPQADAALGVIRAIGGTEQIELTPEERFERALNLIRDGVPRQGLIELDALAPQAPAELKLGIQLQRGIALHKMGRLEDSNKVLEPLTGGYFRYAIPALYHASKNYRVLSSAIDPTVYKTITEKKKVGTTKVRVGKGKKRRTVTKPKFANVKRQIKLIDLAKKQKKESYDRLSTERLKDILQIPATAPEVRLEVLNTLIGIAAAKNQDAYVQELVPQVVKIDPLADPALQHFWDKAWALYSRGDLAGAKSLFKFISSTYRNPNVKRQSEYWFARASERQGQKEEAQAIYRKLASAPYEDLYSLHAQARGAPKPQLGPNPLTMNRPDWREIAEKSMPQELQLAYELTALSDMRNARMEIQKHMKRTNVQFAEALLADIYNSTGNAILMYRSIRRAYPQLATVEQDSVPPYFVKMYYPIKYAEHIDANAKKHNLDPDLVMGLILQESYYNPKARSHVGATGLMQIMPPTGKELARKLGKPFGIARLEDPKTNVELGTLHLRTLINMFGGNQYLAIASYNAGQGNVLRWRRGSPGKPADEFLESIPFPETRNYVKRVTMLRSSYKRLRS